MLLLLVSIKLTQFEFPVCRVTSSPWMRVPPFFSALTNQWGNHAATAHRTTAILLVLIYCTGYWLLLFLFIKITKKFSRFTVIGELNGEKFVAFQLVRKYLIDSLSPCRGFSAGWTWIYLVELCSFTISCVAGMVRAVTVTSQTVSGPVSVMSALPHLTRFVLSLWSPRLPLPTFSCIFFLLTKFT